MSHTTIAGPTTRSGRWRASRVPEALAWVGVALSLVLLAVAAVIDVTGPTEGPGRELASGYGSAYCLAGLVMCVCAIVVARHDPAQRFGWALVVIGVIWALDGFSESWVRYAVGADSVEPGANLALWYLNRFGAVLPLTVAGLLFIFPTGRFLPGWLGRLGALSVAAMVVATVLVVLLPVSVEEAGVVPPPGVDLNAATLPVPLRWTEDLLPVIRLSAVLGVLFAMATAVVRHRRSSGLERDRMRWLVWAVVVMALVLLLAVVVDLGQAVNAMIFTLATLPVVAMTVGVVRPRLVRIEDLLVRTLVMGGLALSLLALDVVVIAVLTDVFGESLDQRQLVAVVLLLAVVAYGPLRQRLARLVQRWILGSRGQRYDVVAGLAAGLESAQEGPEQLATVARAVAQAFGVGYVAVEVERPQGERLTAAYGTRPAEVRSYPITYREDQIGNVVMPARGVRSRLTAQDELLLGDLVRQAATAVRATRLAEELQASRERLVNAREEERRRIRRDLHDGLGPVMAGVVFQLEAARLMVEAEPERARDVLSTVAGQVQGAVADVRVLVHQLRPPALDDRGLVGALSQLAEPLPVSVRIETEDIGGLSAAVEVAAYRIVAEALTNVVRHAHATRATVRLARTDGALEVEVRDDGQGIGADVQAGVGLLSVRERADELGGRTDVWCPPEGGTVVRAILPMAQDETDVDEVGSG